MIDSFKRWPRPLVMFGAVVCGMLLTVFFLVIGFAIARVYLRASEMMVPVPDMGGGIAAIISAVGLLIPVMLQAAQVFNQYSRERLDQQARGLPPSGVPQSAPPAASEPSPTGGLVNNQAIGGS